LTPATVRIMLGFMSDPDGPGAIPASGWYPDPWSTLQQRYWTGDEWTGWTAPAPGRVYTTSAPQPPQRTLDRHEVTRVVLAFIISLSGTVVFWSSLSATGGDTPPSNGAPTPPLFSHPSLAAVGAVAAACGLILSALQLRHLRSTGIRKGRWKVLARIGVYLPAAAIGLVVVAAGTTGM
jgi:Protein of unknown function (DUF2510)